MFQIFRTRTSTQNSHWSGSTWMSIWHSWTLSVFNCKCIFMQIGEVVRHYHDCCVKLLLTYIRRSTPCVVKGLFTAQRGGLTFVGVVKALEKQYSISTVLPGIVSHPSIYKVFLQIHILLAVTWSNGPVLRFLGDFWGKRNIFSFIVSFWPHFSIQWPRWHHLEAVAYYHISIVCTPIPHHACIML